MNKGKDFIASDCMKPIREPKEYLNFPLVEAPKDWKCEEFNCDTEMFHYHSKT